MPHWKPSAIFHRRMGEPPDVQPFQLRWPPLPVSSLMTSHHFAAFSQRVASRILSKALWPQRAAHVLFADGASQSSARSFQKAGVTEFSTSLLPKWVCLDIESVRFCVRIDETAKYS
eukprot:s1521_g7.t1